MSIRSHRFDLMPQRGRTSQTSSPVAAPIAAVAPPCLQLTLDIMQNTPLAMALCWGAQHACYYNSPYEALAGLRPGTAPGGSVPPMMPAIFAGSNAAVAWCGQAQIERAHMVTMWRSGAVMPEAVLLDLFYTPIKDAAGAVSGVLCAMRAAEPLADGVTTVPVAVPVTPVAATPLNPAAPETALAAAPASEATPDATPPPATALARIMVVEDNPDARYLVCEMLQALGYAVESAASAEQALQQLAAGMEAPCDILFTDVSLPGMSGLDLARAAHHMLPRLQVIFASGFGNAWPAQLNFPATAIQKPYDLEQLQQALATALAR